MNDIDTIKSADEYINSLTKDTDKKVYLLASSFVINDEILANANLPEVRYSVNGLLATNHVDRRDGFPNQFFMADIVAVAEPAQYHLRPEDQQDVGVIANKILNDKPANFTLLKTYTLDKNVLLHIYQKTGAYDISFLNYLSETFSASYPDNPTLKNINYFYGLMGENNASRPYGTIYYNLNNDVLMTADKASTTSFALKNNKNFKQLLFDATPNDSDNTSPASLQVYCDGKLLFDNSITGEIHCDLDISSVNDVKFVLNNSANTSDAKRILLTNIELN
jgi:hypothetical protein